MTQTNEEKNAAWRAWYDANKEKQREYMRAYRANNPEKFRKYGKKHNEKKKARRHANPEARATAARAERLKEKYGLTPEQVEAMIRAQSFQCRGCSRDVTGDQCVDHCHATGKIRGILCRKCNLALGHADDNPQTLRALADYLEYHHKTQEERDREYIEALTL
jgi:hypothetical protein